VSTTSGVVIPGWSLMSMNALFVFCGSLASVCDEVWCSLIDKAWMY